MSKVFRLAYCEFSSSDLERECAYYKDVLGATQVEQTGDGARYLSLGVDHHNIVLRPGETSGLLTTGFQLSAGTNLKQMHETLSALGFAPAFKTDARPGVPMLVEAVDVCGYCFHFFEEMAAPAPGFTRKGIGPNRLGHIALLSPRSEELVAFFKDALGFHLTDWFEGLATFLTCNYDHHTINIVSAPISKIHHIAFELRDSAHQYEASDFLAKAQYPILWGPSRHTAGHNYASYHFDPDRTLIELYTDMDRFVVDGGYFEPRPWHEKLPQRPQVWPVDQLNAWNTHFNFDFSKA